MVRRPVVLLAFVAVLLAPSRAGAEEAPARLPAWKAGEQAGKVTIDGKEESFVAFVPKGYSTKKKYPVVLLAHGNGGKADDFLRVVKPMAGKAPPLLVSLERCDNNQDAIGFVPKYLEALKTQFSIDEDLVFALGFSGGGFRLWDDVVSKAEELPKFRGVILVGSAKQSFDPPEKPEKAPTVILVGDMKDGNFGKTRVEAEASLREKGYDVVVHEHTSGHSMPRKELESVFAWIDQTIRETQRARR
jgi:poly(3-hydroxybutyrate) depolymerase